MVVHSLLIHMVANGNGLLNAAANAGGLTVMVLVDVSDGIHDSLTFNADVRAGTIAVVDSVRIDDMVTLSSSGSKCSGDHGHCHHSGQKDRCNPRNSLLSQFHKTTSKLFCVSEKEESLSRYNTFLFFWQMPALSMQEVQKNCQRNKFKSADALLRKMPGAVLRSGRPAGPAGSDPAAFQPGSCPAQRRRTPDRFQLVAPSVCAPPLRSRFSGSQNLHIIL